MSSGLYSHTTRATGTVLTAAIYNADHTNHITNHNPSMIGAYSDSLAQHQLNSDPGGLGSEVLAGSLAVELEQIRFCIKRITGEAQWYVAPDTDLTIAAANLSAVATKVSKAGDTMTGVLNLVSNSKFLKESASSTDGGQFFIEKPDTSTLAGDVVVDLLSQSLRFWENGGATRGAFLDFTECASGASSKLFHAGIAAVKADMEAASSAIKPVVPAHQHHHPGHPKAWGIAGVTGNLLADYGIASVTDDGTGQITYTWDTPFSSASYGVSQCILGAVNRCYAVISQLAGSLAVGVNTTAGGVYDPTYHYIAVYGDQ